MSANNQLVINRKQNGLYKVADVDVDTAAEFVVANDVDGLDVAIEKANDYMQENEVEYGLNIVK